MLRRARVRRTRRGTYKLDLPPEERDVLRRLLPQLRELVDGDGDGDERAWRLRPTAYPDDEVAEAEYRRFMDEELRASRLASIDRVEATLDATEVDEEQLISWLQSINAVRLVLGTLLDVRDDEDPSLLSPDDADVGQQALYVYLSALLQQIVEALER